GAAFPGNADIYWCGKRIFVRWRCYGNRQSLRNWRPGIRNGGRHWTNQDELSADHSAGEVHGGSPVRSVEVDSAEAARPSSFFRPKDRPLLNLSLLIITLFTTFSAYLLQFAGSVPMATAVRESMIFSICLILILGSHEMGHYVLARWHRVDTSLPYFIPLPLLGVGTLGAVIRIRGRIPNRNALVDIGAAGPIAGLVVAIPLLVVGIARAKVVDEPSFSLFLGENSLWNMVSHLVQYLIGLVNGAGAGAAAPGPSSFSLGDNLLTLVLQRLVWGALPNGKT